MWFKNILVFELTQAFTLSETHLETALEAHRFHGCSPQEQQKTGFTPALGKQGTTLVHAWQDGFLVNLTQEDKLIPSAVIQETFTEKKEQLEDKLQRPLRKQDKQALKEEILFDLLPRAFSKYTQTQAMILPQQQKIIVHTASRTKAETVLAYIRKSLGSLPVVPLHFIPNISSELTTWLQQGHAPQPFELLHEAELKEHLDDGAVLRLKQQDLTSPEVLTHLENGKMVEKIALRYQDNLQLVIQADGAMKRLKYETELLSQHDDLQDDPLAKLTADLQLMGQQLIALLATLTVCFGESDAQAAA
ncbi:MAG: recombination-associated protein RdgC [Shewanellaceae bacterium]|nr:recombination-associated protein RdgC [Shewanellaceae bacterium]